MTHLPIIDVPLAELAHIDTRTLRRRYDSVMRAHERGVELPPIWLARDTVADPWLLQDGNHRLTAARHLGHISIQAITSTGAEQQALAERLWGSGRIGLSERVARSLDPARRRQRYLSARVRELVEGHQ